MRCFSLVSHLILSLEVNLLADRSAWDDTELIDAFDRQFQWFKQNHNNPGPEKKQENAQESNHESTFVEEQSGPGQFDYEDEPIEEEEDDDLFTEEPTQPTPQTQQPSYTTAASHFGLHTHPTSHGLPPHPPLPEDAELASLLMSWFYCGYHHGRYSLMVEQRKALEQKRPPKSKK